MRVLLTGANGFIGKNISSILENYCEIIECGRQSKFKIDDLQQLLQLDDVEVVIHAAAQSGVQNSFKNSHEYFKFNLESTINVAEFCRLKNVKKIIYLNTYVYGQNPFNPICENHSVKPHSPYTKSKFLCEQMLMEYFNKNTTVVSLRIFNLFGLHQPKSFFIPFIISQLDINKDIIINDIRPKRDYLYIKDLVSLIRKIIFHEERFQNQIFNVGSGVSYGILEIIDILEKIKNKKISFINKNKIRDNEILDCYANISKVKNFFDWNCQFSFKDGLEDYIKLIQNMKVSN